MNPGVLHGEKSDPYSPRGSVAIRMNNLHIEGMPENHILPDTVQVVSLPFGCYVLHGGDGETLCSSRERMSLQVQTIHPRIEICRCVPGSRKASVTAFGDRRIQTYGTFGDNGIRGSQSDRVRSGNLRSQCCRLTGRSGCGVKGREAQRGSSSIPSPAPRSRIRATV